MECLRFIVSLKPVSQKIARLLFNVATLELVVLKGRSMFSKKKNYKYYWRQNIILTLLRVMPPLSKSRVHERVELYVYSPSGPQWPVIGRTLPLPVMPRQLRLQLHRVPTSYSIGPRFKSHPRRQTTLTCFRSVSQYLHANASYHVMIVSFHMPPSNFRYFSWHCI